MCVCVYVCAAHEDSQEVCRNIVLEETRVENELFEEVVGRKQNTGYHCCTLRCWANTLRGGEGRRGEGMKRREEGEEGEREGRMGR